MGFPEKFLWGAASAAYQVEGGADGRVPGIWDALTEGRIMHGDSAAVGCDHFHRFREDVALMKELGLKSYRFSVAWTRVMNERGEVNPEGLQFYIDLVQELRAAGIEPLCTLYHWNLPMWLYRRGGWENPEMADYFAEYVKVVVEALSDQVRYWMTFNEPQCFIGGGYNASNGHPPFLTEPGQLPYITRNVMLAHGKAVQVIRQYAKTEPMIGFAPTGGVQTPWEESPQSIEEARKVSYPDDCGPRDNNWWADPIVLGKVPAPLQGVITGADLEVIHQPLDFYAFNVYSSFNYSEGGGPNPHVYPGQPRTNLDWAITPEVMYWAVKFHYERYHLPLLVSENGMANVDFVMLDGKVHDPQRIDFIHRYLKSLERAVTEGIPVLGYQYWSIMDNFEWKAGFDKRFGLIYIDYVTLKRTIKDSGYDYAEIIRTNGASL